MNKNKIDKILGLFEKYQVGIVNAGLVTQVNFFKMTNDSDNEVLYLGFETPEDHNEFDVKFTEAALLNDAIINDNGNLVVQDTEGDDIEIQFQEIRKVSLVIQNIE